jgi:hypothetical protein
MAKYCTHYDDDTDSECGQEINEIPYCDFHNSQYTDEELEDA